MRFRQFAAIVALAAPVTAVAQDPHARRPAEPAGIPTSIQREHKELHEALEQAMKRKDKIGAAARDLARVLHPHFVREEQIALAPLGALAPLARNEPVPGVDALVAMTDTLQKELPYMLQEHVAIGVAIAGLRRAAKDNRSPEWVRFADMLAAHAKTEEEIYYPAAIVVGNMLRRASVP